MGFLDDVKGKVGEAVGGGGGEHSALVAEAGIEFPPEQLAKGLSGPDSPAPCRDAMLSRNPIFSPQKAVVCAGFEVRTVSLQNP
jgi:hypothetical protein